MHLETGRHLYGGARQAGYLIDALGRRDCENLLVVRTGHPLTDSVTAAEVIEWPLMAGDLDVLLPVRLGRLIRSASPDIVQVHSRRGADLYGGLAARATGIPSVLTRRVQSREPGFWLRRKCRPFSAVVAISGAVRDELVRSGVDDRRIRLIPSAVDTDLFRPDALARERVRERYELPEQAIAAGAAAQLIPRKGLERLLPLTARLVTGTPEFRLVIFGQGRLRSALERQSHRLGIAQHVRFAGFEDDWSALVPGLDLVLHPARREGLGAVVLEAMSAGIAVVASAVGGIVDAIDDCVNGRLIGSDTCEAWYSAVNELLHNADLRQRIGAEARRTVQARFTIDAMTASYMALYNEVLADAAC